MFGNTLETQECLFFVKRHEDGFLLFQLTDGKFWTNPVRVIVYRGRERTSFTSVKNCGKRYKGPKLLPAFLNIYFPVTRQYTTDLLGIFELKRRSRFRVVFAECQISKKSRKHGFFRIDRIQQPSRLIRKLYLLQSRWNVSRLTPVSLCD